MDLSKKTLLATAGALFLSIATYIIYWLIGIGGGQPDNKTSQVFVLIFAIVTIAGITVTAFLMHRDAELNILNGSVLASLALVAILLVASSSLSIDLANNPFSGTISKNKAALSLPYVSALFAFPALAVTGFSISR